MILSRRLSCTSLLISAVLLAGVGCSGAADESTDTAASEYGSSSAAALISAVDSAIASLENTVSVLEGQISAAEATNYTKANEINALVASIEARKKEIEQNQKDKQNFGIFACMLGYCDVGAVSVAMAINDDSRIKELNVQLESAKAAQSTAQAAMSSYGSEKARVEVLLSDLRSREASLKAVLKGTAGAAVGANAAVFASKPDLPKLNQRLTTTLQLKDNLEDQVSALQGLLAYATAVGSTLNSSLYAVKDALTKADALVRESEKEFDELLKIVASNDPSAKAQKWLEKAVSDRTKEAIRAMGYSSWDASRFVDALLSGKSADGTSRSALMAALSFSSSGSSGSFGNSKDPKSGSNVSPTNPDSVSPTAYRGDELELSAKWQTLGNGVKKEFAVNFANVDSGTIKLGECELVFSYRVSGVTSEFKRSLKLKGLEIPAGMHQVLNMWADMQNADSVSIHGTIVVEGADGALTKTTITPFVVTGL